MSHANRSRTLPLVPVLSAFRATRIDASRSQSANVLTVAFLDTASDEQLVAALRDFTDSTLPVIYHPSIIAERVRFLRHALNHLLRGSDPLADRLARCATPGEAYFVAGLGYGFWSAMAANVD